jgi:hypothetical protein
MPVDPNRPIFLLPAVRRADEIAGLERRLANIEIPHAGGTDCQVIIPENQVSAKGYATLNWIAADTNRRQYQPASPVIEWDTGILFGQYLIQSTLYVTISEPDKYLILFQLDSFDNAGNCNISFNRSDGAVLYERTTTITLGADTDHRAGTMTMGFFDSAVTDYSLMGWHTGGGSCIAHVTVLQLF